MGAYLAVARQSFRRQSTYRAATAAGIFTNSVFGIINAAILLAAFRERANINGIVAAEAVTITFFAQAMLMVIRAFGWYDISDRVRTGEIAVDLQRPLDASGYWGSVFVGQSGFALIFRGIPPFLVGVAVFETIVPTRPVAWLGTVANIAGATILASRWWFLISLGAFWLSGDTRGIIQLGSTVQLLGSGAIIPLQFFPSAMGSVLRASPFAAMSQLPAEVFLERQSALGVLASQIVWAALLHGLGLAGWRLCSRKLVIDGG
jgi:ABC-2 type transport system permease protein